MNILLKFLGAMLLSCIILNFLFGSVDIYYEDIMKPKWKGIIKLLKERKLK